jgi:hypothetical protein
VLASVAGNATFGIRLLIRLLDDDTTFLLGSASTYTYDAKDEFYVLDSAHTSK